MNQQFYETIDNIIKCGITEQTLQYLLQVGTKQQELGILFDLNTNVEYILKRLINACMSTNPQIRENSAIALRKWSEAMKILPNVQKTVKFIIEASNYKKSGNRKKESQAYAIGRVLVTTTLAHVLKNSSQLFESLSQLLSDFSQLEEEVIEALHLITCNKILKIKFQSISPHSRHSQLLHKLFLRIKDDKSQSVSLGDLEQIMEIKTQQHQKKSIILYNYGKYLNSIVESPIQFFRKYANKFLDNDSQNQADINEIYSMMTVLKGYFDSVTITLQNYHTHFDKKIISVWLEQIRVLNKKMKSLAQSISIKFQPHNPELAYKVLVDLHEDEVYLDNISQNHPFSQLYQWVDVNTYWNYLFDLCMQNEPQSAKTEKLENIIPQQEFIKIKKNGKNAKIETKNTKEVINKPQQQQSGEEQESQQEQTTFYNQIEYFIKLRFKQVSNELLCSTLTLLLNRFHRNEEQKQMLYLCINMTNLICKIVKEKNTHNSHNSDVHNKNKYKFNKKMLLLLEKLQLSQFTFLTQQQMQTFSQCILWAKKSTIKIRKQKNANIHEGAVDFFNFYNSLVFFCFIYPDEIETCHELQMVYKHLVNFYQKEESLEVGKTRKVVKRQRIAKGQISDDRKKPIHVLTDIFISLMTKPPTFLRKSIHYVYEHIVPLMDVVDVGNMLTVIGTPDLEFIEQI